MYKVPLQLMGNSLALWRSRPGTLWSCHCRSCRPLWGSTHCWRSWQRRCRLDEPDNWPFRRKRKVNTSLLSLTHVLPGNFPQKSLRKCSPRIGHHLAELCIRHNRLQKLIMLKIFYFLSKLKRGCVLVWTWNCVNDILLWISVNVELYEHRKNVNRISLNRIVWTVFSAWNCMNYKFLEVAYVGWMLLLRCNKKAAKS